jgi:hypothetical protein
MKYFIFGLALLLCAVQAVGAVEEGLDYSAEETPPEPTAKKRKPAQAPLFNWGLFWAGSWEESKTLNNRGELRFGFPVPGLSLRGEVLDRRPLNFAETPPWGDGSKTYTNYLSGLYHKPTGSRLLYGVLDEWGLSARIRSPWIRSAPYSENHKPLMADLKTQASATKEPQAYLYLSSPRLPLLPKTALRGFVSAQTMMETFRPDFSGGLEAHFESKTTALLEGFYTGSELPPRKSNSWFADPPPLPAREFRLYGLGVLAGSPFWSFSSDWAYSETFAWGKGFYGNAGIRVCPPLRDSKQKPGPWSVSLAADGAGSRFTGRDGSSPGAGFRAAGKFEWKGKGSSLFRFNTTLRGPGLGDDFSRSASGLYYRFPAPARGKTASKFPIRLTRITLGADRNASNNEKIIDGIDGTLGLSLSLLSLNVKSPLGINFSGSLNGLFSTDHTPLPYPSPFADHEFDSAKTSLELSWSPGIFQFKTKWGYGVTAKKEGQWDTSFSASVRRKPGRFSVKFASPNFPEKWNCTLSWNVEKK